MEYYSLYIGRYRRNLNFDTLEELKEEVERYFSKSEKPIVDRLTTFDERKRDAFGMTENHYRDFVVSSIKFD